MNMSQYMSVFIDESREHLQLLNDALLVLEKNTENMEIIEEIFRSAHTLKGMSATMGFTRTAELTHKMEDILDQIRNHKIKVNSDMLDLLFECLDTLNLLIDEVIENEGEEVTETEALEKKLENLAKGGKIEKEDNMVKTVPNSNNNSEEFDIEFNEFEKQILEEATAKGIISYSIKVILEKDCLLKAARTYMIFKNLEDIGEVIKTNPSVQDLEEEKFESTFLLVFITDKSSEEVKEAIVSISEVEDAIVTVMNGVKNTSNPEAREIKEDAIQKKEDKHKTQASKKSDDNQGQHTSKPKKTSTVRVDTEKLDSLMNLVAELVINKTRLAQIGLEYNLQDLSDTLSHVDRVTADLQAVVTKVRMVPIESVFSRFPRMVRDLSRELSKNIELVVEGKETELDRTVIDEIGDPLIHLIRNSIDHGIESPEGRINAGKIETGTILLKAEHEGNNVMIVIADDGKGIDAKIIGNKAIEKGLHTEEEIAAMSEAEILKLIFHSGFSTAQAITDVSGRGVGMDVVKTKIEALNGEIAIESTVGSGTITKIKLPLTLAIIEALLVKLKNEIYAIPLANIVETIDVMKKDIKVVQNELVTVLRGEVVPIVNFAKLLEVPEYNEIQENNTVVIVKMGGKKIGLIVDFLIGQQEIVIKSLGKLFTGIKGITGATVLGNGEVALIIDVLTLL
ncbi:MAG: chemotaxis protein CheA [Fusobacteria bacterium]|nr:chemotaxis protein CheA [Fusobacteriota bacterium]